MSEHFFDQLLNFFLRLHAVVEYLVAAAFRSKLTFTLDFALVIIVNWNVGEDNLDVFCRDEPVLIEIIATKEK